MHILVIPARVIGPALCWSGEGDLLPQLDHPGQERPDVGESLGFLHRAHDVPVRHTTVDASEPERCHSSNEL